MKMTNTKNNKKITKVKCTKLKKVKVKKNTVMKKSSGLFICGFGDPRNIIRNDSLREVGLLDFA